MVKGANRHKDGLLFDIVVYAILVIYCFLTLYPLVYILSCSFSSPSAVYTGRVVLLPIELSLESYERVFQNTAIWRSYLNTIYYTLAGTLLSVAFTFASAYPLTRKDLRGRQFFMTYTSSRCFLAVGLFRYILLLTNCILWIQYGRLSCLVRSAYGT